MISFKFYTKQLHHAISDEMNSHYTSGAPAELYRSTNYLNVKDTVEEKQHTEYGVPSYTVFFIAVYIKWALLESDILHMEAETWAGVVGKLKWNPITVLLGASVVCF